MKLVKHRISQLYYTHGLFCASHPLSILVIVCIIILLTCSPLLNLPLPGNAPLEFSTARAGYSAPSRVYTPPSDNGSKEDLKRPRWYVGSPVGYVQQVVVKSVVSPWQPQQMIPADAFRASLAKVFDVLHQLENFQQQTRDGVETLEDVCLHVSEPTAVGHVRSLLPQYSCFVISPANLWFKDPKRFNKDGEIIKTIFSQYGQTIQTPPTIKDLLFGVPWKDTGITRYFIRNRQRVISFAVTAVLKKYDEKFIDALRQKLEAAFPETVLNVNNSEIDSLVHVHYKDFNYIVEYTPLLVTYFVLLLYIYFSVRKIEMVKSQFGLAVSAVVTVVSSLFMSLSLCFFFGLNPTLNGSEIFPYLVMIIGLENVLVITKSVVSTPVHLDVKIRVAQGLSKEGWYITKNLCTELLIIFFGFFTFVPAIQEFCLFALVGLLTDFFLQMFFFATILSVDIRRMELADLHRQSQSLQQAEEPAASAEPIQPFILCPFTQKTTPPSPPPDTPTATAPAPAPSPGAIGDAWQPTPKIYRSRSAPRLDLAFSPQMSPPPSPAGQEDFFQKMPRRLRFFYFWARTRFFQRLIMVCTVIWIALIVYKTGLVEHIANLEDSSSHAGPQHPAWPDPSLTADFLRERLERGEEDGPGPAGGGWGRGAGEEPLEAGLVEHTQLEAWRGLSHKHWPRLFAFYNISILGRYISILPAIHLSVKVDAETAVKLRHPSEKQDYVRPPVVPPTQTGDVPLTSVEDKQSAAGQAGGRPHSLPSYLHHAQRLQAFFPKSQREFFITVCFCFLSVIVISYFMVALYKCMCSRNYSRWRHSWARHRRQRSRGAYYKQIKESVPLLLKGHSQEVECIAVDGQFVVSCCYGGQLRVWDSNTGECLSTMQRHSITPPRRRKPCLGRNIEDSDADLYAEYHEGKMTPESTSSSEGSFIERSRAFERRVERNRLVMERQSELIPDLAATINTDFASIATQSTGSGGNSSSQGFDFQGWFQGVYEEQRHAVREAPLQVREQRVHSAGDGAFLSPPEDHRVRSWSQGDSSATVSGDQLMGEDPETQPASAIWCLTVRDGLIVAGCGNGRIEMWEGETGRLKYQYNNSAAGVTAICFVSNRVVAARMDGSIDFLELETFHNPSLLPQSPASAARTHRGHARQYSLGNVRPQRLWEDTIRCHSLASLRAHQRPVNCLLCEGDRIVSASQDHTLKVFRLEDQVCLYTLYGHEGSVGALCLDRCPPYAAASGSSDGTVRLWDLMTGTCTHKFKWHEEAVVQLATSLQFVVSLAQDDHMCVWERTRTRLLHKISTGCLGGSIILMSHNLGVIGVQGKLELWDLSRGEIVRQVGLQDGEQAFVTQLLALGPNSLVCAASNTLCIVSFPTTLEKAE